MTGGRKQLGVRGEEAAGRYLEAMGWQVIGRNFRTRRGEMDLVAREGDQLVFLEVRTWRSDAFGSPLESIDRPKQQRMRDVAEEFLARGLGGDAAAVRFDVIVVAPAADGGLEIREHLRDAF